MRRAALAVLLVALTGACGAKPVTQAPVTATLEPGQGSLLRKPLLPVTIRTQKDTRTGDREITGADCRVSGQGFNARVTTPAILRIPDKGEAMGALTVTCTHDGETRAQVFQPDQGTRRKALTGAAGAGAMIAGALVAGRAGGGAVAEGLKGPMSDAGRVPPFTTLTVTF